MNTNLLLETEEIPNKKRVKKPDLKSDVAFVLTQSGTLTEVPAKNVGTFASTCLDPRINYHHLMVSDLHNVLDFLPPEDLATVRIHVILSYLKTPEMLKMATIQAQKMIEAGVAQIAIFCCLKQKCAYPEEATTTASLIKFVDEKMKTKQQLQLNDGTKGKIILDLASAVCAKRVSFIDDDEKNVISVLVAKHKLPKVAFNATFVHQPPEKKREYIIEEIMTHFYPVKVGLTVCADCQVEMSFLF